MTCGFSYWDESFKVVVPSGYRYVGRVFITFEEARNFSSVCFRETYIRFKEE